MIGAWQQHVLLGTLSEPENLDDDGHLLPLACRVPWTKERVARLGFLLGLGWSAKRVATDSIINATVNHVHKQAQRVGLTFRKTEVNAAAASVSISMSCRAAEYFDKAATQRGLTYESLISLLLGEIASDPCLLDNILDDGITTK